MAKIEQLAYELTPGSGIRIAVENPETDRIVFYSEQETWEKKGYVPIEHVFVKDDNATYFLRVMRKVP